MKAMESYPPHKDAAYFYGATMVQRFLVSENEDASEELRVALAEKGVCKAMATALGKCTKEVEDSADESSVA